MEIEINFRLDEHGRTIPTMSTDGIDESKSTPPPAEFYETRSVMLEDLTTESSMELIDELLLDAQISDSPLMPRTFWVPSDGTEPPRCNLEQFAFDIFHHHTKNIHYDPSCSGAEWWCQLRPSPEKTGRYAAVAKQKEKQQQQQEEEKGNGQKKEETTIDENDCPEQLDKDGISFHVDKDEDLRIMCGGQTYINPHLSTVTYLTSIGPPTLIVENVRVHPLTGQWMVSEEVNGVMSWPVVGKHTSFDGRYLHAAPPDVMKEGEFERQQRNVQQSQVNSQQQSRRSRRVTFLVNIWLNYKPWNVEPFPESMVDKMSGSRLNTDNTSVDRKGKSDDGHDPQTQDLSIHKLTFTNGSSTKAISPQTIIIEKGFCLKHHSADSDGESSLQKSDRMSEARKFVWPLGDEKSNERLEVLMPDIPAGDNTTVTWKDVKAITSAILANSTDGNLNGFCLYSPNIHVHDDTSGGENNQENHDEDDSKAETAEGTQKKRSLSTGESPNDNDPQSVPMMKDDDIGNSPDTSSTERPRKK